MTTMATSNVLELKIARDSVPVGAPEMDKDLRPPGVSPPDLLFWLISDSPGSPVCAAVSRFTVKFALPATL